MSAGDKICPHGLWRAYCRRCDLLFRKKLISEATHYPSRDAEELSEARSRIEQLEAENERLRETLEWYGVRAASLDNERIMEAVFTELTLDGGTRAGKALEGTDETT